MDGDAMVNPLIPAAYDIVWSIATVGLLVLLVAALISIGRAGRGIGSVAVLGWTLLAILLPLLGPLAWFLAGRPAARRAASAGRAPGA